MEIDNKAIIKRINEFIRNKNLSKTKFSQEIGFSKSYICDILNEKVTISDNRLNRILIAICYKYGLNMQWLKTGVGEIYDDTNIDKDYIISLFDELDIFSQKFVAMIIEVLRLYPNIIKEHSNIDTFSDKNKLK